MPPWLSSDVESKRPQDGVALLCNSAYPLPEWTSLNQCEVFWVKWLPSPLLPLLEHSVCGFLQLVPLVMAPINLIYSRNFFTSLICWWPPPPLFNVIGLYIFRILKLNFNKTGKDGSQICILGSPSWTTERLRNWGLFYSFCFYTFNCFIFQQVGAPEPGGPPEVSGLPREVLFTDP